MPYLSTHGCEGRRADTALGSLPRLGIALFRLGPVQAPKNLLTLFEVICAVRKGLKRTKSITWIPRGHIKEIIRACCNQRYEEHDIESILYKHGDIKGLLVFHLGTMGQTTLFPKTRALPIEMIEDLAKRCAKEEINSAVLEWIEKYDRSKSTISFFVPKKTFTNAPSRIQSNGAPPSTLSLG